MGLGEVITESGEHSQSKDVIIYDSTFNPVFGWGQTGFNLFPIESVFQNCLLASYKIHFSFQEVL